MAQIKVLGNINNQSVVNYFNSSDTAIIGTQTINNSFNPDTDYIELVAYDVVGNFLSIDYSYTSYTTPGLNPNSTYDVIEINPVQDVESSFDVGNYNVQYNVLRNLISSFDEGALFIKEISPDRTELKVSSLVYTNDQLIQQASNLINDKNSSPYLKTYLLNFGNNNLIPITNVALDNTIVTENYILFKLYEPLPDNIQINSQFWVTEEIATTYVFNVNITNEIIPDPGPQLKGPNFDIDTNVQNTLPTQYESYSTLLQTTGSSLQTILNHLNQTSIDINVDYTDFNNFTRFSSAQKRVENFYYKVKQIEDYNNFITAYTSSAATTSSLQTQINTYSASINDIVSKFDGYESYLYFQTGSNTYPHSNTTVPYSQQSTGSVAALAWYNNQLELAIQYDTNNQDNLIYLIPEYIRIDSDNTPYLTFVNMIGQYFDNIYIYLKSVTDLYKSYNNLEEGVSKDLVYYALQDLGVNIYNSNEDDDLSTYAIAVSGSNIPSKDLVAELYKRIYHNVPLLFKGKGSRRGMQELITTFGITGSILGIKEYGGNSNTQASLIDYSNNKVRVIDNTIYSSSYNGLTGSILSPLVKLATDNTYTNYKNDSDRVDISFSPYNQIDTKISASIATTYPTFSIDDYIGDPRNASQTEYGVLNSIRETAIDSSFTYKYDINGFIQLIKFFDNTLFKMLKSYVPAKANLNEGITIRQQALERIKFKRNEPSGSEQTVYDAEYSSPEITEDNTYLYNDLAGNKAAFYTGEITGSYINIGEDYVVQENPYTLPTGSINQSLFNHSDYNVLLNNISSSRLSLDRLKIEIQPYTSSNLLVPVELQDSYESLTSYQLSRHEGVKLSSLKYNTYTTASSTYEGDISYGQTATIDRYSDKIGLFTEIVTSSFFPTRLNARLKYLVDKDGNLTELNTNNKYWFDTQNFFPLNNNATVTLFNDQQYSNQKATNGSKPIFNSGYSYSPMLYYSSSNVDGWIYFEYTGNPADLTFSANNIQGIASSSLTSDYPIQTGSIYNVFNSVVSNPGGFYITGSSTAKSFPTYSVPIDNAYKFSYTLPATLNQTSSLLTTLTAKIVTGSTVLYSSSISLSNRAIANSKTGYVYYTSSVNPYTLQYPAPYPNPSSSIQHFSTSSLAFDTYDENNNLVGVQGTTIYLYNLYGSYNINGCTFEGTDGFVGFTTSNVDNISYWNLTSGVAGIGVGYCVGSSPVIYSANSAGPVVYNLSTITYNNNISSTLYGTTPPLFLSSGSKVGIQLSASLATNVQNLTLGNGSLAVELSAQQGGNLISASLFSGKLHTLLSPNTIRVDSSLTSFLGYLYYPYTGSTTTDGKNSLFAKYGDVEYNFNPQIGDILYLPTSDQNYEFNITNVNKSGSNLYLTVSPDFVTSTFFSTSTIREYVYLKRVKDETNVILNAKKRDGKTSYGFLLPPNLSPTVLNNIDTIARQIQQKLNLAQ
jgi:hypothetical protein